MQRRTFLKTAGAGIAITGIAASGVWFSTRTPTKVFEPWQDAGQSFGDARLDALAYAILAPNPHNRQPWQVKLIGKNSLELYCDLDKRLDETDPYDRQILLGLGCFTEIFAMAAANKGFSAKVTAFPQGEPGQRLDKRPIAHIELIPSEPKTDELFNYVLSRRTAKVDFNSQKAISQQTADKLNKINHVHASIDPQTVTQIKELSYQALEVEMTTPRTLIESVELMRIGRSEVEMNPDGISFYGVPMEAMNKLGLMTREKMHNPNDQMNTTALDMFKTRINSSAGFVWLSTGNSRTEQFQAGRDYLRLNLTATSLGLAMQPLSQALQEYPEMDGLFNDIHQLIPSQNSERIQMLCRIGYCDEVAPSPRWPMEASLIHA